MNSAYLAGITAMLVSLMVLGVLAFNQAVHTLTIHQSQVLQGLRCDRECYVTSNVLPGHKLSIFLPPPSDPDHNKAIWLGNPSKDIFEGCVVIQNRNDNTNITLREYQSLTPKFLDTIHDLKFSDGDKFILKCEHPNESVSTMIPKCLSQEAVESSYQTKFHAKFPAWLPEGYRYQCGIYYADNLVFYAYWNKNWREDPDFVNPSDLGSVVKASEKGVIAISVARYTHSDIPTLLETFNQIKNDISSHAISTTVNGNPLIAVDTSMVSYAEFLDDTTNYTITGKLGTKEELLKIVESLQ